MSFVREEQLDQIENVAEDVKEELAIATEKHGPMVSYHEAYAVILEEMDEVWDEIKKKRPDQNRVREELIQIAAMAMRAIIDVC